MCLLGDLEGGEGGDGWQGARGGRAQGGGRVQRGERHRGWQGARRKDLPPPESVKGGSTVDE